MRKTSNSSIEVVRTPFWKCNISKSLSFGDLQLVEILRKTNLQPQSNFCLKEGGCASTFVEESTPNYTWVMTSIF